MDHEKVRVVILGSGFAGIEVLKRLQKKLKHNENVNITLVSRDNFLLFTPMLPEVSTGMIETRHIVTPTRSFIKKARFYEANVESIDLDNKKVVIIHSIGRQFQPTAWDKHTLEYDYLVIALGSETNFFGIDDIKKNAFTMMSIDDAVILRNHILSMLEQASIEQHNRDLRKSLLKSNGRSKKYIVSLWSIAVVIGTISSVIGFTFLSNTAPSTISIAISFAAGAILVMLAESEAHAEGGSSRIGIATMAGFAIAFILGRLGGG